MTVGPAILHTFAAGLEMISAPEDFSGSTFAKIFDTPPSTVAVWNATTSAYILGPTSPADTIRPGQGYWARFPSTSNLLDVGTKTDPTVSYSIVLKKGWNIIGDPWSTPVGLGALSVIDTSGNSYPLGTGSLVAPDLYTLQVGDIAYEVVTAGGGLQPFYGYWIYAYQNCTLQFPGTPTPPGGPSGSTR